MYRLVHCDEITEETHEITYAPAPNGQVAVTMRKRGWWERFKRRLALAVR